MYDGPTRSGREATGRNRDRGGMRSGGGGGGGGGGGRAQKVLTTDLRKRLGGGMVSKSKVKTVQKSEALTTGTVIRISNLYGGHCAGILGMLGPGPAFTFCPGAFGTSCPRLAPQMAGWRKWVTFIGGGGLRGVALSIVAIGMACGAIPVTDLSCDAIQFLNFPAVRILRHPDVSAHDMQVRAKKEGIGRGGI